MEGMVNFGRGVWRWVPKVASGGFVFDNFPSDVARAFPKVMRMR